MLLREALELWTTTLAAEGKSPHTTKGYREHLRPIFRYLEGQAITEIEAISPFPIRRYLADYQATHSPYGAKSIFTSIRAF
ncbi:MAG TPA: site-specific integrase, partial [Dehalococcoidia bacterium]|nr:site-specific integrase [Dehalococcoidia bacterium]